MNMPRKLPWLVEPSEKPLNQTATKRKEPASSDDEDLVDSDLNPIRSPTPEKKKKPRHPKDRSPSTSPPPAPPDAQYMREGYQADDIYRMVEDEFYSTAQLFTQHIHRAEYVRLKKLARSRGAGTLKSIAHGTDGWTKQSRSLELKLEADNLAKDRKAKMRDMNGEDDNSEDEDAYMMDPHLAGLMAAEQRPGKDLVPAGKVAAKTRAAAGLLQSPKNVEHTRDVLRHTPAPAVHSSNTEQEDDDDLDMPPTKVASRGHVKVASGQHQRQVTSDNHVPNRDSMSKHSSVFKQFAKPTALSPGHKKHSPVSKGATAVDDMPRSKSAFSSDDRTTDRSLEPRKAEDTARSEWLAKRLADKKKRERDEKRKANIIDDIPTFLF